MDNKWFGSQVYYIGPFPAPISGTTIKNQIISEYIEKEGITVKRIDTAGNRWYALGELFKFLFVRDGDLIVSVSAPGRRLMLPYIGMVKLLSGSKVILIPCGGTIAEEIGAMTGWRAKLYSGTCRLTDKIYVETEGIKDRLDAVLQSGNIEVLHNVKPRPHGKVEPKTTGPFKIVYLGRLRELKGIFVLLDAVKKLNEEQNISVHLDYYGNFLPGDEKIKKRFLTLVNEASYIQYMGYLEPECIHGVLQGYDALAFPTYFETEGFPGVLVDAAYAGLPVLATRIANNTDIIEDGMNGVLCMSNDVGSLARAIQTLECNREGAREMGRENLCRASAYDPELAVARVVAVLTHRVDSNEGLK